MFEIYQLQSQTSAKSYRQALKYESTCMPKVIVPCNTIKMRYLFTCAQRKKWAYFAGARIHGKQFFNDLLNKVKAQEVGHFCGICPELEWSLRTAIKNFECNKDDSLQMCF